MTTARPLVATSDLNVHFPLGGNRTLKAVDGVSLAVMKGETFGVIGESGSGKTTLGRAIVCLQKPSGGQVWHDGLDPNGLSRGALRRHRRAYQIIFQDPNAALDPRMTILDAIREPLDISSDLPSSECRKRALDMLRRVGLGDEFAQRFPHELSGGQKQRVCIARVLTLGPSVIVCDEAVSALDVSIQADILNLFAELQRELGLTYIFITHNLSVVAHISDRIAVMYLGRVIESGRSEDIIDRPLHPYTEALLSAEPMALPSSMRGDGRIVLQGELPSPISPPSGCRFRTRCRYVQPICAQKDPSDGAGGGDHWAACHFAGTLSLQGQRSHRRSDANGGVL